MSSTHRDVFMTSPINAILEGLYEANTTLADLKEHGDFGIGTFNDLDGELVLLDGTVYHLDIEGDATVAPDHEKTPFATVCFFEPISEDPITRPLDDAGFNTFLERCLPSANMLYAIRVEGRFAHMRTRSVPRTANHTPLVEATAFQKVSDLHDVAGTLVGFFTPGFIPSVNVPGFHFHFLTEDRKRGGHLLECTVSEGQLQVQFCTHLHLALPVTLDYLSADFERDARADIEQAER